MTLTTTKMTRARARQVVGARHVTAQLQNTTTTTTTNANNKDANAKDDEEPEYSRQGERDGTQVCTHPTASSPIN